MPASRPSRYSGRYDRLLEESLAVVQDRDFSPEELARAAEDALARIPGAALVPIESIEPNPDNPRRLAAEATLRELADSIAERGLLQPLVVRRAERPGHYAVIAGSRRLLAARLVHGDPDEAVRARVALLPCIIKEASERDAFADALLENLARADLSRAEMMEALLRLHRDYGWSANYIARRTGRNQSDISQLLGVARHPELSRLVREEVIKPTVAGEINRLPPTLRDATIAEVRAGAVRTVADVKRRRPVATADPADPPAGATGQDPGPAAAGVVISLPPEGASTQPVPGAQPQPEPRGAGVGTSGITHSQSPAVAWRERLEGIGALAGMVEAETAAGRAVLEEVGRDLDAAYEKLAAYLARRGAS